jgi:hypothetical protein
MYFYRDSPIPRRKSKIKKNKRKYTPEMLTRTVVLINSSHFLQASVFNLSFCYALNPDTRMVRKVGSPGAIIWLRGRCTAKLHQCLRPCSCTGTRNWSHLSLYRDCTSLLAGLHLDGKNCAVLRSLRPL